MKSVKVYCHAADFFMMILFHNDDLILKDDH